MSSAPNVRDYKDTIQGNARLDAEVELVEAVLLRDKAMRKS